MKLAIACCLLAALLSVGCRKKKPTGTEVANSEVMPAAAAGNEPGGASGSVVITQAPQAVPTLKGVGANSDHPLAKAPPAVGMKLVQVVFGREAVTTAFKRA